MTCKQLHPDGNSNVDCQDFLNQMTLSVLAESVLDSETRLRVVPVKCLLEAGDDAGPTLHAPIGIGTNIALRIERVHFRWAYEQAVLRLAFRAADFLVYLNVSFFVDFEDVLSEFFFNLQLSVPLYLEQVKAIFHRCKIEKVLS